MKIGTRMSHWAEKFLSMRKQTSRRLDLHLHPNVSAVEINPSYKNNKISTTKYNPVNAVPKFLYDQFSKPSNLFFLFVSAFQQIPGVSPTGEYSTLIPLLFVICVSLLKEALEDYRRHCSDKVANNTEVHVWCPDTSSFIKTPTYSLRPGCIVLLRDDERVPSDLVVLATSAARGTCYIETSGLDGESNLKVKTAAPILSSSSTQSSYYPLPSASAATLGSSESTSVFVSNSSFSLCVNNFEQLPSDLGNRKQHLRSPSRVLKKLASQTSLTTGERQKQYMIECEYPCAYLYSFTGRFIDEEPQDQRPSRITAHRPSRSVNESGHTLWRENQKVIPLSNDNFMPRGSVLRNTRWAVCAAVYTGHDTKMMLNAKAAPIKRSLIDKIMNRSVFVFFILIIFGAALFLFRETALAPNVSKSVFYNPNADQSAFPEFFTKKQLVLEYLTHFVILHPMIPISLFVTLEIVKAALGWFIGSDHQMHCKENDTYAVCNMSSIVDDLGAIGQVVTDKTGTLTQNRMKFKECCFNGIIYNGKSGLVSKLSETVSHCSSGTEDSPAESDESLASIGAEPNQSDSCLERLAELTVQPFSNLVASSQDSTFNETKHCLLLLATCNTVIPDHKVLETTSCVIEESQQQSCAAISREPCNSKQCKIVYQATSADEEALVKGAAELGFVLHRRGPSWLQVLVHGELTKFEVMNVCEFTSARKRMSVVLRFPDNTLVLYCKGADNIIIPRTVNSDPNNTMRASTLKALGYFCLKSYRTLCAAYRVLDEEEFMAWKRKYNLASASLTEREKRMEDLADVLERDMKLIGATAVEDKLQHGVKETLSALRNADVKVWMATGDRYETAVNIAHTSGLITSDMQLLKLVSNIECENWDAPKEKTNVSVNAANQVTETPVIQQLKVLETQAIEIEKSQKQKQNGETDDNDDGSSAGQLALVVDGHALTEILGFSVHEKALMRVAKSCRAVICSRMCPLQKALVVQMARKYTSDRILAIGDGANDVPMIQAAHVGVGIAGLEGRQAAMSADFSIAQFSHLKRLMFVHGSWCQERVGQTILFCIFKCFCLYFAQIWYLFSNGISSQTLVEPYTLVLYNILLTAAQPFAIGLLSKHTSARTLLARPKLYKVSRSNHFFSLAKFWLSALLGIFYSGLLYIFIYFNKLSFVSSINGNKGVMLNEIYVHGALYYVAVVLIVTVYALLSLRRLTWILFAAQVIPAIVAVPLLLIFFSTPWASSLGGMHSIFLQPEFAFTLIVSVAICTIIAVSIKMLTYDKKLPEYPKESQKLQSYVESQRKLVAADSA